MRFEVDEHVDDCRVREMGVGTVAARVHPKVHGLADDVAAREVAVAVGARRKQGCPWFLGGPRSVQKGFEFNLVRADLRLRDGRSC